MQDEVKVLGRIGEGAFGEVSLATCAIFGKVAVKWLKVGLLAASNKLSLPVLCFIKTLRACGGLLPAWPCSSVNLIWNGGALW